MSNERSRSKIPAFRIAPALAAVGALLVASQLALPGFARAQEAETQPSSGADDPAGFFTELVDVRVINVDVVVTDRSGESIAGLQKDDFELRVDGQVVPVANFYAEAGGFVGEVVGSEDRPAIPADTTFQTVEEANAGAPRRAHVVILVDHTRLRAANRKRTFNALRETISSLGSEDLVSVVGIEGSLVFYSDFLYDREALDRILNGLTDVGIPSALGEIERRQIFGELARGISGGIQARASQANEGFLLSRIRSYAEQEYARSLGSMRQIETVIQTLNGVPGRKALIYVGEGIPTRPGEGMYVELRNRFSDPDGSIGIRQYDFNTDYTREIGRFDLNQQMILLAKAANRAGVTLYAIDAEGDHGAIVRSALTEQGATSETLSVIDENFRAPLEATTKATGGRLLRSSGRLADQILDVVGDLQTFYSLGFNAPDDWDTDTDHDIEVKVKGQNFVVRHREEVKLPKPDELEASATVAALMYQTANNPLGIRATPGSRVKRDDGNAALPVDLQIPIEKLGFLPTGETQSGSLTIYVSTKDAEGNPGKVQKIPFHIDLPEEIVAQAIRQNDAARYPLPLVLEPGDSHVAIGVRDNVNGVFSAIRLDVAQYSRF